MPSATPGVSPVARSRVKPSTARIGDCPRIRRWGQTSVYDSSCAAASLQWAACEDTRRPGNRRATQALLGVRFLLRHIRAHPRRPHAPPRHHTHRHCAGRAPHPDAGTRIRRAGAFTLAHDLRRSKGLLASSELRERADRNTGTRPDHDRPRYPQDSLAPARNYPSYPRNQSPPPSPGAREAAQRLRGSHLRRTMPAPRQTHRYQLTLYAIHEPIPASFDGSTPPARTLQEIKRRAFASAVLVVPYTRR